MAGYAFQSLQARQKLQTLWEEQGQMAKALANSLSVPLSTVYTEHCRYNGKECPDRAARLCLEEYPESEKKFEFYTTGVSRTGCMFCAFGAHLESCPNRFQQMQETHPKQYDYCMRPVDQGGLGMAEVLDYIGIDH